MLNESLFSSKKMTWGTPQKLFDTLNAEFHFTLDPCADDFNHKCDKYYTEVDDGLSKDWGTETVFCNPPYGREIGKWVKKCSEHRGLAVMLIPARTDTKWFHDYIWMQDNVSVSFLPGRIKFEGAKYSAPFPSMIVTFRGPECR